MRPTAITSSTSRGSALRDAKIVVTNHPPEYHHILAVFTATPLGHPQLQVHCCFMPVRAYPSQRRALSGSGIPSRIRPATVASPLRMRSFVFGGLYKTPFALHRNCCGGWLPKDEFVICGSVCSDLERVQATNLSCTNHRIAESSRVSQPIMRSVKSLIHLICPSECSNRLVVTCEDGVRPAFVMKM